MREQLIQYVRLLFAGTTDTYDIQQEILQNTLDKYDDLIEQGKSPEAAYRLAISGIGDINEILGQHDFTQTAAPSEQPTDAGKRKLLRSIAIALYILCAVPLFLTDGTTLGLCFTLLLVAVATAIMVYTGKGKNNTSERSLQESTNAYSPQNETRKMIRGIIWGGGICLYVSVSLITRGWYITWIIFPMLGAVEGLVNAIIDLKEAAKNEN